MASELRVNTLKDASGNNSIATSFVAGGSAKAFIQYSDVDGTFDETFNASSTTDNGNGDANYGLTSSMSSVNFPASGEAGGNFSTFFSRIISHEGSTASSVRIRTADSQTHTTSVSFRISSIIFGDLA